MSHYVRINCNALEDVKGKTLQKALKRINSNYTVKMLNSLKEFVPSFGCNAVVMDGKNPTTIRMDIQKRENGKTGLTVGGEFYHTGYTPEGFTDALQKNYNSVKIEDYAKTEGLQPLYKKVEENGEVVMRFRIAG